MSTRKDLTYLPQHAPNLLRLHTTRAGRRRQRPQQRPQQRQVRRQRRRLRLRPRFPQVLGQPDAVAPGGVLERKRAQAGEQGAEGQGGQAAEGGGVLEGEGQGGEWGEGADDRGGSGGGGGARPALLGRRRERPEPREGLGGQVPYHEAGGVVAVWLWLLGLRLEVA